jgi:Nucleotidyl transferase AbiEii toxin, Type IV TA system
LEDRLIPNQILRVLSTFETNRVRYLLMGGQACVLYGAAEFSRDIDVSVLASGENLDRLAAALAELNADVIAVPPFEKEYLNRGHAVHFRCSDPVAERIRVDVMSKMRGVADFDELWDRRTTLSVDDGFEVPLLSLPDLVAAKKTQRDKDWPMIRRLVEANYEQFYSQPSPQRIEFWLAELRTPHLLVEAASRFPNEAQNAAHSRPAVAAALTGDHAAVEEAINEEIARERAADRAYWAPLRQELEQLRWNRGNEA